MEWIKTHIMAKLGNERFNSEEAINKFITYVSEHIDELNNDSFDILLNLIELIPDEIIKHEEFYRKLYKKSDDIDPNKMGFRNGLRYEIFRILCEDNLKFNEI